ncbi:MAG: ATP-dependent Clp protease proteolytic subunit [Nannocystaceae bacterium]
MRRVSVLWYALAGAAGAGAIAWLHNRRVDDRQLPPFPLLRSPPTLPSPTPGVVVLAPEWGIIRTEHVLPLQRALEASPESIGIVIHTLGGTILAVDHIAHMLSSYKGRVTVYVPYMALSGGTMIATAADEIVMEPSAILGPVDPQLNGWPAVGILELLAQAVRVNRRRVDAPGDRKPEGARRDPTVGASAGLVRGGRRAAHERPDHARPADHLRGGEPAGAADPPRVPRELVASVDELVGRSPHGGCFPPISLSEEALSGIATTRIAFTRPE